MARLNGVQRVILGGALLTGVTVAGVFGSFVWEFTRFAVDYDYSCEREDWDTMKQEALALARRIDEFRRQKGEYPVSLAAARISPATPSHPLWRYERAESGLGYFLTAGRYTGCGWVCGYSRTPRWRKPDAVPHELRAEGDALLRQFDEFVVEHGRFPDTLAEMGVTDDWGDHGPWTYFPPANDERLPWRRMAALRGRRSGCIAPLGLDPWPGSRGQEEAWPLSIQVPSGFWLDQ